jgi:excisionase family DNA binding protein
MDASLQLPLPMPSFPEFGATIRRNRKTDMANSDKLFTPREAAQVLGISYPTLKQWIYKNKIRTIRTVGGHHRIPVSEVDAFLYRASERRKVAERRSGFRHLSGPNQLTGRITDVRIEGLMRLLCRSVASTSRHHGRRSARDAPQARGQSGRFRQIHGTDDHQDLKSSSSRLPPAFRTLGLSRFKSY